MSDKAGWEGRGRQSRNSGWGKQEIVQSSAPGQGRNSAVGLLSWFMAWDCCKLKRKFRSILLAGPVMVWGPNSLTQTLQTQITQKFISEPAAVNLHRMCCTNSYPSIQALLSSSDDGDGDNAKKDLESCHVHEVKSLPGSHQFGSDFIEAIASDPDPKAKDRYVVWGLTADLSSKVPPQGRAMYISKSTNGGKTWTPVARIDSKYFDADIGEGERNGLSVFPGGTEFVITTQRGAFQIVPGASTSDAVVKAIRGPRVPQADLKVSIPKKKGDPVKAGVVQITADGAHMTVGYGYFDLDPQIFIYHRGDDGSWIEDGPLPHIPSEMDLLSMQFDDPKNPIPKYLYVGTGDQVYRLNTRTMKWARIGGVGADSAVQGISMVGGPHFAACWGVYNPSSANAVRRVTNAKFLLHRDNDQAGPNIRAYSIEVDPSKPNREVVTSLTGVYASNDRGKNWKRINDLPDEEFRSAHFNSDGTIIVSGIAGTFLANPFSAACSPRLKARDK